MLRRKLVDIAANLTDPMFQGNYRGSVKHPPDLDSVLSRAWGVGVERIVVTGTSLEESAAALGLAEGDERLFCTVGCHPTMVCEFDKSGNPDKYLSDLRDLAKKGGEKVVAWGEFGLDYDRLHFAEKDCQLKYFERQLELSNTLSYPLFLHCRAAFEDFSSLLRRYPPKNGGVVHSFDGTSQDAEDLLDLGLHIGLNGCSLRTEENLLTVANIPPDRILLETDCPWCEVRPSHASYRHLLTPLPKSNKKEKWSSEAMVKSRNEPANILQILEIVAAVKETDPDELCEQIYKNSLSLFFPTS